MSTHFFSTIYTFANKKQVKFKPNAMNKNRQTITDHYTTHRNELLAYVSSRLGNHAEAEDVVQSVYLRLLMMEKMISSVSISNFCYTIAMNLVYDYFRQHTLSKKYAYKFAHSHVESYSIEPQLFAKELTCLIDHSLKCVPENCRNVYRMHIYEGMKVSEISTLLGEDYKSVEYRLGAARREVRRRIQAVALKLSV